jgi:hypothetical protein
MSRRENATTHVRALAFATTKADLRSRFCVVVLRFMDIPFINKTNDAPIHPGATLSSRLSPRLYKIEHCQTMACPMLHLKHEVDQISGPIPKVSRFRAQGPMRKEKILPGVSASSSLHDDRNQRELPARTRAQAHVFTKRGISGEVVRP